MNESYPLTYSVDYPDRTLNRLTTFFRIFTVIPIAIVLGTVAHATYRRRENRNDICRRGWPAVRGARC